MQFFVTICRYLCGRFFNNGIMMDNKNKKGDVSNKIVGRDKVERLIEDYGHKGSGLSMEEKFGYLRNEKTIVKVRIISFPLSDCRHVCIPLMAIVIL